MSFNYLNELKMEIIILSGVPWSWKSTFRDQFIKYNPNTLILSSDSIRDEIIETMDKDEIKNKTGQINPFNLLYNRLEENIKKNQLDYIIIDATNVSKKERKKAIEFIKNINNEIEIIMIG